MLDRTLQDKLTFSAHGHSVLQIHDFKVLQFIVELLCYSIQQMNLPMDS